MRLDSVGGQWKYYLLVPLDHCEGLLPAVMVTYRVFQIYTDIYQSVELIE